MSHVCGGVIGYPITPSTEISELYEAARAEGGVNVWGKHPFFFEPEGEHSAQSGALGAALTGGQFISNASSSQGILYAMESHYVTVGKKIGGFVLQVAARVVSKHSLNVMAGHDDVYALLSAGYTILFGSNPQEAADLAAISYRTSALSLIPVANAMDGFSTSHMLSEALLPEPELLREYLGDPAGRIKAPTVAQELLFGAKGRVFQLTAYLDRHRDDFRPQDLDGADRPTSTRRRSGRGRQRRRAGRRDAGLGARGAARPVAPAVAQRPGEGHPAAGARARRRQQPRAHRPGAEPARLPGRGGRPPHPLRERRPRPGAPGDGRVLRRSPAARTPRCSPTTATTPTTSWSASARSPTTSAPCCPYLRAQGLKVGVVSVKLLQPFPEAELVEALAGAKAVTVLERSDQTALTSLVTPALFKARANAETPAVRAASRRWRRSRG